MTEYRDRNDEYRNNEAQYSRPVMSREDRERRRRERMERRRREIRRKLIMLFAGAAAVIALAVFLIVKVAAGISHAKAQTEAQQALLTGQAASEAEAQVQEEELSAETEEPAEEIDPVQEAITSFQPYATENTAYIANEEVISPHAVLIDADTGEIIAQKDADLVIYPASMTKILTLLTAVKHLTPEQLDDTYTIPIEVSDYAFVNKCSIVGFSTGETVTVRDLLYGTILPSGADAAMALALYVAGSQEAFVEMMNAECEELGIAATAHFTNPVGIHDDDNHCTLNDMAIILHAAIQYELCRDALSAHVYTTSQTTEHPEGIEISNWFLRRIEDKDTHGTVLYAKTGYVNESGSCAASFQVCNDGSNRICVSSGSSSSWRCIYDQVAIYAEYCN